MKRVFILAIVIAALLSSCEKEELLITSPKSITIYREMMTRISATKVDGLTFTSEDESYAIVDENGVVTGLMVGETNIIVSSKVGTKIIPVTILPKCLLYDDMTPYLGATESEITTLFGDNFVTTIDVDGTVHILYQDYTTYVPMITFVFENERCSSIQVIVPNDYSDMLSDYLIERYTLIGAQNEKALFQNHDRTISINCSTYSTVSAVVSYSYCHK